MVVLTVYSSTIIVTTSSRKERLESYLSVGDITLTAEDIAKIDKAGAKGEAQDAFNAKAKKVLRYTAVGSIVLYAMRKVVSA
jgi:diketogulonate reductase-like aldo/keto reductase